MDCERIVQHEYHVDCGCCGPATTSALPLNQHLQRRRNLAPLIFWKYALQHAKRPGELCLFANSRSHHLR